MRVEDWPLDTRVSIEAMLQEAKTGDLLLLSGNGSGSFIVKGWSWKHYSHCGIVIRDPNFNGARDGASPLYIWNANVDDSRIDAIQGKALPGGGSQLNDLEMFIRAYDGIVLWRPLSQEIPRTLINPILKDLSEKEFNHDYLDLIGSTPTPLGRFITRLRGPLPCHDDRHFCSDLVTRTYQLAGVLDETQCSLQTHPADYEEENDPQMGWKEPYRLGFTYLVETPASVAVPNKMDLIEEVPFFGGD